MRTFVGTTSFLRRDVAYLPGYGYPSTFFCWCRPAAALSGTVLWIGDSTRDDSMLGIGIAGGTGKAMAYDYKTNYIDAQTPRSAVVGKWHAIAGRFPDKNSRSVFLDGMRADSATANGALVGTYSRTSVGVLDRLGITGHFAGDILLACIWDALLTDEEIVRLSQGWDPEFVRPQNISFYQHYGKKILEGTLIHSQVWRPGYGPSQATVVTANTPQLGPRIPLLSGLGSYPLGSKL